ncbi:hypothetical protein Mth01_51170 [Sphaerimonospora thailandensis]|uniref:Uncharacterized protein n=1 Tax=Sphaerimonospora thailandensis TaxID=795644 RepID=A0A8J3RFM0_9ACTN|nr:hypothetical protein [Sphaerimonospora thailandensis]GIH72864.1 hypothetical protein Mth01_51170 [Sphaerimonospora thailandensis]
MDLIDEVGKLLVELEADEYGLGLAAATDHDGLGLDALLADTRDRLAELSSGGGQWFDAHKFRHATMLPLLVQLDAQLDSGWSIERPPISGECQKVGVADLPSGADWAVRTTCMGGNGYGYGGFPRQYQGLETAF